MEKLNTDLRKLFENLLRSLDVQADDYNSKINKFCKNCVSEFWCGSNKNEKIKRGCCVDCAEEDGYFNYFPDSSPEYVNFLKKRFRFSKKYGFFDPKTKRCKLGYLLKSKICNAYCCPTVSDKLKITNNRFAYMISILRKFIIDRYGYEEYIKILKRLDITEV